MGPFSAFRRIGDIATRRPKLVALLGFGLIGEGARVVWSMKRAGEVALLGHSGLSSFDAEVDRPFLLLYVAWVTLSGILLLGFARRGERARAKRALAATARTAFAADERRGVGRSERTKDTPRAPVIERRPRAGD
ncbi:MAG: hypothetical protein LWW93_09220 [Hyphomicrobiales bacterium]|nr:hypothetical protein [Hyphomicrobiales bacterium]